MARLRDVPRAVRADGVKPFALGLWRRIVDDDLTNHAAAVAYSWLFAVFPFLIFLITLSAYLPKENKDYAKLQIDAAVRRVMARDAASTVTANLDQVLDVPRGGLLSVGLAVTLWIASGGMRTTMGSLDQAYDAKRRRPFYLQWPLAVLLTIVVAALLAVVLLLMPVGTAVEGWMAAHDYVSAPVLWGFAVARTALAVVVLLAFLAVVYQFGTCVRHPFAWVSPGAAFTVAVWFALGAGFRAYVDRFGSYQKTYGALGGVAILLLFFYLDALVLLVGAEINSQIDHTCAAAAAEAT